jgi:hypothetical protein
MILRHNMTRIIDPKDVSIFPFSSDDQLGNIDTTKLTEYLDLAFFWTLLDQWDLTLKWRQIK